MKCRILDFKILYEEISPDNIKMSELIAFSEVRFQIDYIGGRMQKMYADLYTDIKHKHETNHVFSDGYNTIYISSFLIVNHYPELAVIFENTRAGKRISRRIIVAFKVIPAPAERERRRSYPKRFYFFFVVERSEQISAARKQLDFYFVFASFCQFGYIERVVE